MQELGCRENKDQIQKVWKMYARGWSERLSPWRPSAGDIALYEQQAGSKLSASVLLLGATPELRDLIAKHQGKLTLIDMSPEMIETTNRLLRNSRSDKEELVIGDWCENSLPGDTFDLVIGDVVWWLLSTSKQKTFLEKISKLLRSDGLFVSRIHYCNTSLNTKDLKEIVGEYLREFRAQTPEDKRRSREVLTYRLLDATTDKTSQRLSAEKALPVLEYYLQKSEDMAERSFLEQYTANWRHRINWTSQPRELILDLFLKQFTLVRESYAKDYEDARYFPVVSFKKLDG